MLKIEHAARSDDPNNKRCIPAHGTHWLIGDWERFSSKDEAQQAAREAKATQQADAPSRTVRKNAEQVWRVMQKQETERQGTEASKLELIRLAESGSPQAVEGAIKRGADLRARELAYKRTPLMVAAASNTNDVVFSIANAVKKEHGPEELHVTTPVRELACLCKMQSNRPVRLALHRGTGGVHSAALGGHEQPRRPRCVCGEHAPRCSRRPELPHHPRRHGPGPRRTIH
jgi:hypothetical protein